MKSSKNRTRLPKICFRSFIFLLSLSFLTACGGGGGGGRSELAVYSGKTAQATVTITNAGKLMSEVQEFGGGLDDAAFPLKPGGNTNQFRTRLPVYNLISWIESSVFRERSLFSANKPVQVNPLISVDGDCGGRVSVTGTLDDVTLKFDFNMRFNAFCNEGAAISGNINASGTVSRSGNVNISAMTMKQVTIKDGPISITMDGNIFVHVQSFRLSDLTMNVVIRNNADGKTIQLENYRVTTTDVSGGVSITLQGRFFSPEEGFVDVSTVTPLFVPSAASFPSRGVLITNGFNGTKTRLTAIGSRSINLKSMRIETAHLNRLRQDHGRNWEHLSTCNLLRSLR